MATSPPLPPAVRTDINVGPGGLAFTVSNVLSGDECDALVAASEAMGYSRFAPAISTPAGMRLNSACHWFASSATAAAFLEPMYARFAHLLPPDLEGGALFPRLSHRVAHYKYDNGDVFNRHTDGQWPGQSIAVDGASIDEWPGAVSRLSMLLYLTDGSALAQGGATRLFMFGPGGAPPLVRIANSSEILSIY